MSTGNATEIRFGICTDQNLSFDTLAERWRHFEALGFDSVWDCDHFNQTSNETGPTTRAGPCSRRSPPVPRGSGSECW